MDPTLSKSNRRRRNILIFCHAIVILLACSPAIWIQSQSWKPVAAKVESTRIERTRPGTPAWSLLVDFTYEVNQKTYPKKNTDVFHNSERKATEAEQKNWPAGREVTGYCSEKNPESFTLQADGNLEVSIVLAVLAIFITSLVALPFYIALARSGKP